MVKGKNGETHMPCKACGKEVDLSKTLDFVVLQSDTDKAGQWTWVRCRQCQFWEREFGRYARD
jgi:hypothetical protein